MGALIKMLPAAVGGWDTRSALTDMPPNNAVIMDNWFPGTDKVELRRGHISYATGMSGNVESLIPYTPLTGTGKMFAANGTSIYNVTDSGAVGAAVVSSLTNARFQYVQMGTSGGQFILIMNGADTPRTYDGTSWANTTITGPTVANLIWCNLHQRRLWFGEKQSLSAWYLAVNSVGGAATEFPLAAIARLGGYIMAMATWTQDAGDGVDDVAVFLTSEGEAIIYSGTDPSSATTWALVGVFRVGKPIGRRCMAKAGADLIMLTQDGAVFASSILHTDRSQAGKAAITAQINPSFNAAVRDYGSLFGWEPFVYPRGTMLIFNVPQSSTVVHQYVFNTLTGAPCRFTGMNALCWGLLNDKPYFGGTDGVVYEADNGNADNGANIEADVLSAFTSFGSSRNKAFKLAEVVFESDGNPSAALDLCTDYVVKEPTSVAVAGSVNSALWGVGKWGVGLWGTNALIYRDWRGIRGIGRTAALRVRVDTNSARPSIVATNISYVNGGGL